jgi:hypothetical protein
MGIKTTAQCALLALLMQFCVISPAFGTSEDSGDTDPAAHCFRDFVACIILNDTIFSIAAFACQFSYDFEMSQYPLPDYLDYDDPIIPILESISEKLEECLIDAESRASVANEACLTKSNECEEDLLYPDDDEEDDSEDSSEEE